MITVSSVFILLKNNHCNSTPTVLTFSREVYCFALHLTCWLTIFKGTIYLGREATSNKDQVSYRSIAQILDMDFHNVCFGVYKGSEVT